MAEQYDEDIEGNMFEESTEKSALLSGGSVHTTCRTISHSFPISSTIHAPQEGSKVFVVLCILLTELCERLTFYGLTANLLLFSSEFLGLRSPWPSIINYLFQGTCYLVPIFGGWLADSYMGRFNVIYGSGLIYFVGTVLLALVSIRPVHFANAFGEGAALGNTPSLIYFGLALTMIVFGTGGIKVNVSPFGADQVQQAGPAAVESFFNIFYWFINVGSLISFTAIVYIQQKYDFVYGYIITACTMLLALLLFVTGRNRYWHREPQGSQLTVTFKVIHHAIKNRKKAVGNKVASWLDHAKDSFGGPYSEVRVEDVKGLLRLVPIFGIYIVFWMIYNQGQTTFLLQATYLRLTFNSFEVPAASLAIFDIIIILALIPFMDRVAYPALRACGIRCTPFQKITVGLLFAAGSVAAAGVLEIARKNDINAGNFVNQTVFDKVHNASDLNVFFQTPQFLLMGIAEVLANITGLEFAYSQAPRYLQGLVMGCYMITSALGNYAALLLVVIVRAFDESWYPSSNPNHGKMEVFFFILAALMILNVCLFLRLAFTYEYKSPVGRDQVGKQ